MVTYILILILGHSATVLEFPSHSACLDTETYLVKELNNKNLATKCFLKIGGENKSL